MDPIDITPPRFPDDYYAQLDGRHAAAVAAVELVGILRNGGRLSSGPMAAEDEPGLRRAVTVLIELTIRDWRDGEASDSDYLLALRAHRALQALLATATTEVAGERHTPTR